MKIFRIFGIDIQLHFSWWFVFVLLAWSLSDSFFPNFFPGLAALTYWLMGIVAVLLLFVSVLLHELSHSLVAKARKIKVESITLFFFGGVAGITKEDLRPQSELLMAMAGPLFSLALGTAFFFIYQLNGHVFWTAISFYLYQLNFILGLFNLVPAFPLDGGRAFRALLYAHYKDLKKATKIASKGGKFFAGVLVALGLLEFLVGTSGGLWFILLGGFLYFIAGVSYEQVVIKEILGQVPVRELMRKDFFLLDPKMKFADFVKECFPGEEDSFVVWDGDFQGILDVRRLEKVSPSVQKMLPLKQMAVPLAQIKPARKEEKAYLTLQKMTEQNLELLPVMEGNKVLAVVTRRAILRRLIWELKFGEGKKKVHK